ncbi:MAG: circadian clock protein KaiC [Proteobacteria bacterium]|nr:MAG: circadian clock protein KaiC [Pseudomonadota bacterium]
MAKNPKIALKSATGVPGLDEVLGGGLPKNHLYLLQGKPGTGKTTLALQFLLEGVREGESVLYVTFSETKVELDAVAESHDWDLSGVSVLELSALSATLGNANENTLFHPSEIELSQTIKVLLDKVEEIKATRVVFDSISELRLMAESSFRYRRQMLSFKEFFIGRNSTVLFLDDLTTEAGDLHVQSIVHGVLLLEKFRASYGVERRQFHIVKLRGVNFRGGTHDYLINTGGIVIFPRLVSGETKVPFEKGRVTSGLPELDSLLGGGLDRGSSSLILGPAGTGKSTICIRYASAAAERGLKVAYYSFEENTDNIIARSNELGIDLKKYIELRKISIRKIDPAELTPGQFTSLVLGANNDGAEMIIVDSLNGYVHAMPEQQFLLLQLHELLSYLGNRGVITVMVLAQAGIMGRMESPLDLTYLADTVIVTRFFEAFGRIRKAISVIKKRGGPHEETLREFRVGQGGIVVGPVLENFTGIFTGTPTYSGDRENIMPHEETVEEKLR